MGIFNENDRENGPKGAFRSRFSILGQVPRLRNRSQGVTTVTLTFVLAVTGCSLLLTACSPPVRAPVISREKARVRPVPRPPPRQQRAVSSAYHRVVKGDTLYSISWRYGTAHHTLARWNRISPPYTIYPGQKLRLSPVTGGKTLRPTVKSVTNKRPSVQPKVKKRKSTTGATTAAVKKPVYKKKSQELLKLSWGWPTRGTLVQSFAKGDPYRKGVKLRGKPGQPVKAAEAGKVVYAGSGLVGYGRLIIIKHNKIYLSAYGLNQKILVKEAIRCRKAWVSPRWGAVARVMLNSIL